MFKKLFQLLNKDLTGSTWEIESSHPYFGEIVFYGFKDQGKCYWECEVECEGNKVFVGIESPDESQPSDEHVEFTKKVILDLDSAFSLAAPLLIPEFEKWYNQAFPEVWRDAFTFTGMVVPSGAKETNDWELTFESLKDPNQHSFTCYFREAKPSHITVDG